jgi:hypothetical protein
MGKHINYALLYFVVAEHGCFLPEGGISVRFPEYIFFSFIHSHPETVMLEMPLQLADIRYKRTLMHSCESRMTCNASLYSSGSSYYSSNASSDTMMPRARLQLISLSALVVLLPQIRQGQHFCTH